MKFSLQLEGNNMPIQKSFNLGVIVPNREVRKNSRGNENMWRVSLCFVSITRRDCPQKLCLNFPAHLENLVCRAGTPEAARLTALGH